MHIVGVRLIGLRLEFLLRKVSWMLQLQQFKNGRVEEQWYMSQVGEILRKFQKWSMEYGFGTTMGRYLLTYSKTLDYGYNKGTTLIRLGLFCSFFLGGFESILES